MKPNLQVNTNLRAFLDTIAWAEGTTRVPGSADGYNVLVGGTLFEGYADHPRKVVQLNRHLRSSAAGRYQLLARYYDHYRQALNLPDFSPDSQDAIAIQQISECKALPDIEAGRIRAAVAKCARIWASFPDAGYGQHEHSIYALLEIFQAKGGECQMGL